MRLTDSAAAFLLLLVPASAGAVQNPQIGPVSVYDAAGTGGKWQEGQATVAAPPAQVKGWLLDFSHWRQVYPDIQSVEVQGRTPDGRTIVKFRSSIVGRPVTIYVRPTPTGYVYQGKAAGVTTEGRDYVLPAGPGRSRVVLQTTAHLHGPVKWLGQAKERDTAKRKLASDLSSLQRVAAEQQSQQ